MRPSRKPTGFTLIEMAIVLAIIAVLITMSFAAFRTTRQRAELSGIALDLRALVHQARAEALATGHDVAVMVFPDFQVPGAGIGRVIVYSDGDRTLFSGGAAVNFDAYDPRTTATGPQSEVLSVYDVSFNFRFGPATGQTVPLQAPYAGLPVNSDCTFCGGAAGSRRGAIVFNYEGAARFQSANGPPAGALAGAVGGSITLQSNDVQNELRTLAVVAATGAVRSIQSKRY